MKYGMYPHKFKVVFPIVSQSRLTPPQQQIIASKFNQPKLLLALFPFWTENAPSWDPSGYCSSCRTPPWIPSALRPHRSGRGLGHTHVQPDSMDIAWYCTGSYIGSQENGSGLVGEIENFKRDPHAQGKKWNREVPTLAKSHVPECANLI